MAGSARVSGCGRFVGRVGLLAAGLGVGSLVVWLPSAAADDGSSGVAGSAGAAGSTRSASGQTS